MLLFLIAELPIHGYQIIKELERRSQGYFNFSASTVYSALRRLEKEGLVMSSWQQVAQNQKRRYYQLTEKGRNILAEQLGAWQRFYSAISKVVEANNLVRLGAKELGNPDSRSTLP